MAKSTTNKRLVESVDEIVNAALFGSMKELRREAKQQHYRIQAEVAQFFDLFAAMAIDTPAAPALDIYTPTYAPLSAAYKAKKPSGRGFFYKTGDLQSDVQNLTSQTTNLLGKSSFYIEQSSRGAKKGFTADEGNPLRVRGAGGRFVRRAEGLKNFRVKIVHQPFSKVDRNFKPRKLEKDIFAGAYDEIYNKLTNQQTRGRAGAYRPAFYSFMRWWFKKHLPEVLK